MAKRIEEKKSNRRIFLLLGLLSVETDALHKAQLTLISDEKLAHPFYWAPFILIGDWR